MRFNTDKCKVMHMGRENPCQQYFLNGKTLGKTDMEKDLGILVSVNLTVAASARQLLPRQIRSWGLSKGA